MAISLELILGIIGSVTGLMGATSLLIQILKYLKERPRIEAKLLESKHHYQEDRESKTNYWLVFLIDSLVKNKGDRATTVAHATLDFKIGRKEYRITSLQQVAGRIESNDMVEIRPSLSFSSSYNVLEKQERIPFKLILFHTHGEIRLESTSNIMPT
jgi:hypothetical protein